MGCSPNVRWPSFPVDPEPGPGTGTRLVFTVRSRPSDPTRPHRPTAAGPGPPGGEAERVGGLRTRAPDPPRSRPVTAAYRRAEPRRRIRIVHAANREPSDITPAAVVGRGADRALAAAKEGPADRRRPKHFPAREPGGAIPTSGLDAWTRGPPTALATHGSTDQNRRCPPRPGRWLASIEWMAERHAGAVGDR
jgi:hypothetical protein